jgi:AraC family transcriptional regulator
VALQAGYGSHEAFTRAFHDQFRLRPEEARNGRSVDTKPLVEPIKMETRGNTTPEEPRVERKGALTIAGLGARFRLDESQNIPALWQKFQEYEGSLNAILGLVRGVRRLGRREGAFLHCGNVRSIPSGRLCAQC